MSWVPERVPRASGGGLGVAGRPSGRAGRPGGQAVIPGVGEHLGAGGAGRGVEPSTLRGGDGTLRLPAVGTPNTRGRRVVRDIRRRHVIRGVDVATVFKVSLMFYFCVLLTALVAGVVLWDLASAFGVLKTFDKLVRSLFALSSFTLRPLAALVWGSAIGAVLALIGTLVNVLAAILYNLISDVVGGVQVFLVDDDAATGKVGRPPASPVPPERLGGRAAPER
ncbi:MAG: DUF3566 domain-containing protein [Acidimicrobiales bacterium]